MDLRPYQKELIDKLARELLKHNRVIMCAPTGSGKTVVFASIIARHLERDLFNRVLVLTHRTELFAQTIRAIARHGTQVEEIRQGKKITDAHSSARCIVAMVETLKRRKEIPGEFTLVIADEAHRADFAPIINTLPETTHIIGATATPISASKKTPLKDLYDSIITAPSIPELIEMGYLSKPQGFRIEVKSLNEILRTKMGEYTDLSQVQALGNKAVYTNMIEEFDRIAHNKRTLVFCVNAQHTRQTATVFSMNGYKTEYVLSDTTGRDGIFERFRKGETQILVNCDIATTGTDIPEIECVLVMRATKSLPLWMQMVGRGARVIPDKKDSFTYIDFGGNYQRHGAWETDFDWVQKFKRPQEHREGLAPTKSCPECDAIIPANVDVCSYCGHVFLKDEHIQYVEGELIPIMPLDGKKISHLIPSELVALVKSGVYSKAFAQRVARTEGYIHEYGRLMGYKKGWAIYQAEQPKGYTNYTVRIKQ